MQKAYIIILEDSDPRKLKGSLLVENNFLFSNFILLSYLKNYNSIEKLKKKHKQTKRERKLFLQSHEMGTLDDGGDG